MPVHDWTRVDAGLFHDFHQSWTVALSNTLNMDVLPPDYFALLEQSSRPIPPLTLDLPLEAGKASNGPRKGPVATVPPRTRLVQLRKADPYPRKANLVTVRHRHGDIVTVIEIMSPGNKAARSEFRAFVDKSAQLIRQGVNLLVIDLFPPGPRDPQGIHKALWDEFQEEDFALPPDKPLTLASYDAGTEGGAYVEFVAVGDPLPDMPIFLKSGTHVLAPLETTYQATWSAFPTQLKGLLEPPATPPPKT